MRAGLFPFHVWVPAVHPHLPTNTHAMVSAVMLKLPVYLMIRLLIEERVGPLPAAWGAVLLLLATVTALVSVWHATVAADLKTALAGHSVENVAVIVAGLGTVVLFDGRHTTGPLRAAAAR